MTEQMTFDIRPLVAGVGDNLDDRFADFIAKNDWIVPLLERMAEQRIREGATRIGVKELVEDVRYHHRRQTVDTTSRFRLNNSYTSRVARLLLQRNPGWSALIETRALASERAA